MLSSADSRYNLFRDAFPSLPFTPIKVDEELGDKNTFNERFQQLHTAQNALEAAFSRIAASNPKYLTELFKSVSNPYYQKSFNIEQVRNWLYTDFFDNSGQLSDVPANCILLPCNEFGRIDTTKNEILVFDGKGKCMYSEDVITRNTQGGLHVFVRVRNSRTGNTQVFDNDRFTVVVLKRFLVQEPQRVTFTVAQNTVGSITFIVNRSDAIRLGPVVSASYYQVGIRTPGDAYFRYMDKADYNVVMNDLGEVLVTVYSKKNLAIENGTTYSVMNTMEFAKIDMYYSSRPSDIVETSIVAMSADSIQFDKQLISSLAIEGELYFIPLVTVVGGVKHLIPVHNAKDLLIWVNGRKLIPDVNFSIYNFDQHRELPPSIVFPEGLPYGENNNVKIIINDPKVGANFYVKTSTSNKGIVDFSPNVVSYGVKSAAMSFSNGYFVDQSRIDVVSDYVVSYRDLHTERNLELYFSYINNSVVQEIIDTFVYYESDLSKILRVMGTVFEQFLADYIVSAGLNDIDVLDLYNKDFQVANSFPTLTKLWLRDETVRVALNATSQEAVSDEHGADLVIDSNDDIEDDGYFANVILDGNPTETISKFIVFDANS